MNVNRQAHANEGLSVVAEAHALLAEFGLGGERFAGGALSARSPVTGETLVGVQESSAADAASAIEKAHSAFLEWRLTPAPKRGELLRLFAEELRASKLALGRLVSIETGKILSEGLGEVQEMIDVCDFAVGISRQLYGLTMATERREHRMMETWHPIGVVGIISAFNFPVAVWCWNAALALVCGDAVVWKPSEKTPLTAFANHALFERAIKRFGDEGGVAPVGLSAVLIGGRAIGEVLVDHPRVPLVSATGSTAMGRAVGPKLARRFARAILELGGNNGAIVAPTADLDLTLRAAAFAAMGTAGQRCTTLRRLIVHESVYERFVTSLKSAYANARVGNPLEDGNLIGPLIDQGASEAMQRALEEAEGLGGAIVGGDRVLIEGAEKAFYRRPALIEMERQVGPVLRETFAPILYVLKYRAFDEALELHNAVPQGLSSSIFTSDLREAEAFLSVRGSDCGIANVNVGPSGAEIGGAFGGEKESGGGRESGSDSWKAYMRRATNTINYGSTLPLAQGVEFNVV